MKKLFISSLGLLLSLVFAVGAYGATGTYCEDLGSSSGDGSRSWSKTTLTAGTAAAVEIPVNVTKSNGVIFRGVKNTTPVEIKHGEILTIRSDGNFNWMYNFIWIDWNGDAVFDETTEKIGVQPLVSSSFNKDATGNSATRTFTATVPSDAKVGVTRVRVMFCWKSPTEPNVTACSIQSLTNNAMVCDFLINISANTIPTAVRPTFTPAPGTYATTQNVTIATETADAVIHYTTDGTEPTVTAPVYSAPIIVDLTKTIKAFAAKDGMNNSAVSTAEYRIERPKVATPIFTPGTGTYSAIQNVTIATATDGAKIYYTTDGSEPTTASIEYTSPVVVNASKTIKAIAAKVDMDNSLKASAAYVISLPGDYCKPGNIVYNSTSRWVRSMSINGGTAPFSSGALEAAGTRPLYSDKTVTQAAIDADPAKLTKTIQAAPGATLQPVVDWAGEWMHGYLYVDYNNNGSFTDAGELVSYTFYDTADNQFGKNSLGETVQNNSRLTNVPRFTLPADLANGLYRIRLKIDWNNLDPCGGIDVATVYGSIIDFTLNVKSLSKYTVTYAQSANGTFTVINGTETVTSGTQVTEQTKLTVDAVPAEGYTLKNIKVNDVALAGNSFSVTANSVVSAEFTNDRLINITSTANGTVSVVNAATSAAINDGDWIADQTQVKITLTPAEGYKISSASFAGVDILSSLTKGEYTTTVTKNSMLNVVFAKITYPVSYTFDSSLGTVAVTNKGVSVTSGSQIEHGSVLSFTVNSGTGNFLSKVLVDGVDRTSELITGTNTTFSLTITKAETVEIVFDSKKYALTTNTPEYGTMTVSNEANEVLANGANVVINKVLTVVLTPNGSNGLTSLLVDDGGGEAPIDYFKEGYVEKVENKYTTQVMVAGNVSLTATFSILSSINNNPMEELVNITAGKNTIKISAPRSSVCDIYDLTGSKVSSFMIDSDVKSLFLNTGMYIVKVSTVEGVISKKIIVTK